MKLTQAAVIGLIAFSGAAFAAPVSGGAGAALKQKVGGMVVPKLGTKEVTIVQNLKTGVMSVQAADGTLIPLTAHVEDATQVQKVCYGGCDDGFVAGDDGFLYDGPYRRPGIVVNERKWERTTVYPAPPVVGVPVPEPVPVPVPVPVDPDFDGY